ncbi:phosphate acyltransferase PlsX [Domibacillus sp. DTU_2020_1001157_1_SI_ALB_TIR_016]|uniref:phosphate acyltransferase PlsX n=1 Tax=Domibacillus sp. DTU_2020_1001157_1_SI_ALB_TIR_016 TaxID=3077789 RepID=UPI0028EEC527|nr:phosphate acyltransferase PlsX [Domibacillus sp. DTU_2020_1001157_1_SI_ALB_TIR_016]WNS79758.1 phosphate acyltransferase PlsX [Domibacillus sp. DTU_2020_1001157_1_SI_ALB_TIR_016]
MKLAIDAMGGDHAPEQIILGVNRALKEMPQLEVMLYGDEEKIRPYLEESSRAQVVHAPDVILGTDEPVRAVRRKKQSSLVLMAEAVAANEAAACVSAGNTGALMAAGLFVVGRIDGVERPALAPTLPTIDGKGFVMLDAGANSDAKPEHLLQYAIMGSVYAEKVRRIPKPRVGLLNIGTEEKKGNDLTKAAYKLLSEAADLNFIGNIESRELLNGAADVVVTDGFTGNMVLKTIEGSALSVFSMLKTALTASTKSKIGALLLKDELCGLKSKMDYTEYGGAGLFGLKAPVIKAHGSSDANAFYHAIEQAYKMAQANVPAIIESQIATGKE